jgi:capsular exopolysaccharide synthesis family protein
MVTELYTIRQDASVARNQYDVLLGQMREIEAEAGLQLASTRIVSPAVLPVRPSFPDPGLVLLFALGASASLGVALAFLNEYFVGGVTTEAQLSAVTGVPAAGSIPFVDETSGGRFSPADRIVDMPLTGYAEAFRNIRAAIDQGLRGIAGIGRGAGEGQVIVVTSAQSGEGKTTAALALARTYAAAGKKTLLIDADLRRPSIHHRLGVAPVSGFGQYLRAPDNMKGPQDFYARDPASNLALILGAERAQESTDNLLNSAGFADIIGQARSVYDVTIIDTPPVLQVVDARYVVPFADAVILAVRWASTGQPEIKAAVGPIRNAMGENALMLPVLTQTNLPPRSSAYDLYQGDYSAAT